MARLVRAVFAPEQAHTALLPIISPTEGREISAVLVALIDARDQAVAHPLDGREVARQHLAVSVGPGRDVGKAVAAGVDPVVVEHDEAGGLGDGLGIAAMNPGGMVGPVVRRLMARATWPSGPALIPTCSWIRFNTG